jgi:hypothetical protein
VLTDVTNLPVNQAKFAPRLIPFAISNLSLNTPDMVNETDGRRDLATREAQLKQAREDL